MINNNLQTTELPKPKYLLLYTCIIDSETTDYSKFKSFVCR